MIRNPIPFAREASPQRAGFQVHIGGALSGRAARNVTRQVSYSKPNESVGGARRAVQPACTWFWVDIFNTQSVFCLTIIMTKVGRDKVLPEGDTAEEPRRAQFVIATKLCFFLPRVQTNHDVVSNPAVLSMFKQGPWFFASRSVVHASIHLESRIWSIHGTGRNVKSMCLPHSNEIEGSNPFPENCHSSRKPSSSQTVLRLEMFATPASQKMVAKFRR